MLSSPMVACDSLLLVEARAETSGFPPSPFSHKSQEGFVDADYQLEPWLFAAHVLGVS